jgi:recombination protein RecA
LTRDMVPGPSEEKQMALKKTFAQLQAKFNTDPDHPAVMWASDIPVREKLHSGSLALDFAMGGGMPSDRCVELAGEEKAGKTTLALHTLINFLDAQPDRGCLFLDTEHKLTESWMEKLIGRERMGRVVLTWPDHIEQATDMYTTALESGDICICILDSIGGSPTMRTMVDSQGRSKSAETGNIGGNALGVSRFSNIACGYSQKYHCLTLGINQVREDMTGYHQHVTPGGRAWKHACVLRLQLKRTSEKVIRRVNGEDIPVGFRVKAKVIKNQLGVEGRTAEYFFYPVETEEFGFGLDTLEETVRLSLVTEVVRRGGANYYHDIFPDGVVKSKEALFKMVKEDRNIQENLSKQVIEVLVKNGEIAAQVAPVEPDLFPDYPDDGDNLNVFGRPQ